MSKKLTRTVVFPLMLDTFQYQALRSTMDLYTQAWQRCVDTAWVVDKLNSNDLHHLTYYPIIHDLKLLSQLVCSARKRAFESVKSAKTKIKQKKKASKPFSKRIPVRLDRHTLSFNSDRSTASIATQEGRIKVPLTWHKQALRYTDWTCKAGEYGLNKHGNWVLRLVFEKDKPIVERSNHVIGLDRGIKHVAVSSDNVFYGKKEWTEKERRMRSLRSRLQSKGTKSAKRRLKKTACRLKRFRIECDRIVAKSILSSLNEGDTLILERLTGLKDKVGRKGKSHKKHRSKVNRWSYKRLENALLYKSAEYGIFVEYIDPAYTSQICSSCGQHKKSNRKTQSLFKCDCGLELNADLNAARNIKFLWLSANGAKPGVSVNNPIVGTFSDLQAPDFSRG